MDINQHVTNRLRLNISTETLLGITNQPPESCQFNNPVISSLNACVNHIQETMDSIKEGSFNRWITIEYDEENLEALRECVEQMHYWHDDILDQIHRVCVLEGIDIDDTDLNDIMLEYNTVFEKTVSDMPEHIFNEGITKLKRGVNDAESAFYHESRIIDAYNELSSAKAALEAFECNEDEPDPDEDEAAYDLYHENRSLLNNEIESAEKQFNNLISEMEHDAESAIDYIKDVVELFDQTLRRQMELYRQATKELKNNLKNLLPEEMGIQPALRLKKQMEASGDQDNDRLYVGTWDRLKERLIEEITSPHTYLRLGDKNTVAELSPKSIKTHGRVSRALVIKELRERDDKSARRLMTAIITDNFKVSSIAAYNTLTDAMLGREDGIIVEVKSDKERDHELPALAS